MSKIKLIVGAVVYVLVSPICFAGCLYLAKMLSEHGASVGVVNGTCCLSVLFAPGMLIYGFVGTMI